MNDECIASRGVLYPLEEPKEPTASVRKAKAHLDQCASCEEFFRQEREFLDWLRPRLPTEKAPAELRERILLRASDPALRTSVASKPLAPPGRRGAIIAAAAVAAAAILFAVLLRDPTPPGVSALETALVEDHIRYLPNASRAEFPSSDATRVSSWFSDKLHFPVRAPFLSRGKLMGARLCFLMGQRVALLFYEVEERPLSLFVLDGASVDLSRARFEEYEGKPLCRSSRSGYQLVLWQDRGLVYAMVSELSAEVLLGLAAHL
jgi:anti-sigma factor RsiW